MAPVHTHVTRENLKTNLILDRRQNMQISMSYDDVSDTLTLQVVPNTLETVVLTIDDYVGLLYLPDSLEMVGVFIEDVAYGFLAQHPELQGDWKRWTTALGNQDAVTPSQFLRVATSILHAVHDHLVEETPELALAFA